ncbi:hypothetical protein BWZ20_10410 [Winogradskyella sp. J14-2]|uniref:hypothetical protein n=1 Tax=Winogradskyella sp. J14-2 TaxID=1936080 RepID=UPI000972E47E|nr:hypothetical protein [Winogradskyella sp. J14-2]APY08689.1 hypothetical protein BWZ20_10410 [Winogradskyella sp. J14-2]
MKTITTLALLCFSSFIFSQVGVGNTDPQARLDISASSTATPSNEDGILIPRIDNFPTVNPTVDQDGMMVFYTGTSLSGKGFYYWDNSTTSWISITAKDSDWLTQITSALPNSINENMYTLGNIAIGGINSYGYKLYVDSGSNLGTYLTGSGLNSNYTLSVINSAGRAARFQTGNTYFSGYLSNNVAVHGTAYGTDAIGGFFSSYDNGEALVGQSQGSGTAIEGWAYGTGLSGYFHGGELFANDGFRAERNVVFNDYGFPTSDLRVESDTEPYMLFVDASLDRIGIGLSNPQTLLHIGGNTRIDSELQIGNPSTIGYALPTIDGTNGQVMTTDGAGNLTFQDAAVNTDNQQVDTFGLVGNNLGISLEDDGVPIQTVNLDNLSFNVNNFSLAVSTLSGLYIHGGTGYEKMAFSTIVVDTQGEYITTNNRFRATNNGYYRINATYTTTSNYFTGNYGIAVYKNGTLIKENTFTHVYDAPDGILHRSINCIVQLDALEYIEIYMYSTISGILIDQNSSKTYFEVERIR